MSLERRDYAGWTDSWWLSNGEVVLVVPSQIGPRVMRYGRIGGPNLFHNFVHALGRSGDRFGRIAAGTGCGPRRKVPPARRSTMAPSKSTARSKATCGSPPQIEIRMAHEGTDVTVLHRITNRNRGVVRLAPWGLSVMRPGGVAA
ncbi:hypothetical protein SBA4_2840007 [Candidatus Sulfopaludibacter sp. SbA4]|nr:hypothetical protein SBA4_2840007 [Candidatus Sulfopaludibacter sp. SbA4]